MKTYTIELTLSELELLQKILKGRKVAYHLGEPVTTNTLLDYESLINKANPKI